MNTANTCQTNLHATLKVCPRQNLMTQIILLKSFSHSVIQQYWVCFFLAYCQISTAYNSKALVKLQPTFYHILGYKVTFSNFQVLVYLLCLE